MSIDIESATGPLAPADLGVTLTHEHVFINMTPTESRGGYMTVWQEREADLRRFAEAGGSTLFDMTNGELSNFAAPIYYTKDQAQLRQNPVTGSRSVANVLATAELSRATGVNVVLGTGHYFCDYFDTAWFDRTSTSEMADFLIADILDEIPGTGIRAGFLGEIASNLPYITAQEERSFRAAGRAARETGRMVSTHAPTFATGEAQIDILTAEGVEPERIVVGHSDTVKNVEYSIDLLRRGVYVQYDCMMACKAGGHVAEHELQRRVDYFKTLVDLGYADKLLLSNDVSERHQQAALGGPGLTFVFEEFAERAVAAGIDAEVLHHIHTDNPRRVLFGE
ncbi:phosphotriesterase family protein [Subtercola endophyticus]|uniref:phosphotriesterase family protein n=1 Tax=Subtercola endophyticus TaxID=2895559 RepID=UPI001E307CFB|nr:hypothetical protein [Subtercola endophyticus]UFS58652.1 hypothetical protein LQ955_16900 [Subtercola endophyticus]